MFVAFTCVKHGCGKPHRWKGRCLVRVPLGALAQQRAHSHTGTTIMEDGYTRTRLNGYGHEIVRWVQLGRGVAAPAPALPLWPPSKLHAYLALRRDSVRFRDGPRRCQDC